MVSQNNLAQGWAPQQATIDSEMVHFARIAGQLDNKGGLAFGRGYESSEGTCRTIDRPGI